MADKSILKQSVPMLVERTFLRPVALAVIVLPPAAILVGLAAGMTRGLSADELGVAAAVPLVAFYVFSRLWTALTARPTREQEQKVALMRAHAPAMYWACVAQALFLLAAVVAVLSAPLYAYMQLTWAWINALKFAGLLLLGAGAASVVGGLSIVFLENQPALVRTKNAFVGWCESMLFLTAFELRSDADFLRLRFVQHSEPRGLSTLRRYY
jgi:uncharacterized membrane protein